LKGEKPVGLGDSFCVSGGKLWGVSQIVKKYKKREKGRLFEEEGKG